MPERLRLFIIRVAVRASVGMLAALLEFGTGAGIARVRAARTFGTILRAWLILKRRGTGEYADTLTHEISQLLTSRIDKLPSLASRFWKPLGPFA
jgi:hypothetical protein